MVFKRIFAGRPSARAARPEVPEGQRIYAVGDIHGRLDLLNKVLEEIEADDEARAGAETTVVFLGDLVDRGPDSRGVIERLMALQADRPATRLLLGNHDEVFLKAASGDTKAMRFLTRIGGRETILSYGVSEEEYRSCDFEELARLFAARVPAEHVRFVSSFDDYVVVGDYLFVHAGIRPGLVVEEQSASDLRWIRRDFLEFRKSHSHMVVHGHSISEEAQLHKNRIGIDTGAFASGRLTALGLERESSWLLTAQGEPDPRWLNLTD